MSNCETERNPYFDLYAKNWRVQDGYIDMIRAFATTLHCLALSINDDVFISKSSELAQSDIKYVIEKTGSMMSYEPKHSFDPSEHLTLLEQLSDLRNRLLGHEFPPFGHIPLANHFA